MHAWDMTILHPTFPLSNTVSLVLFTGMNGQDQLVTEAGQSLGLEVNINNSTRWVLLSNWMAAQSRTYSLTQVLTDTSTHWHK